MEKILIAVLALSAVSVYAEDCSNQVGKAALKASKLQLGAGRYVEADSFQFIKTTKTNKDQYQVTIANSGASTDIEYVVFTNKGTCQVVGNAVEIRRN